MHNLLLVLAAATCIYLTVVGWPRALPEFSTSGRFVRLAKNGTAFTALKWIVVTSVQLPTDNVKRLASYPDWTLVVVADKKTPKEWHLDGVHFLSVEEQESLAESLPSIAALPYKSYTRKNIGYLYAIAHGAEWIYDTDDDNVPFERGLDEFDYSDSISGLRYQLPDKEDNTSIVNRLFNPYRHFGVESMWPRGFPLEHIQEHAHRDGAYRSCGKMKRPAVQQGIVRQASGLHEEFHPFAPTVMLAPGTYSPWNSQNTLFHRDAFFGLFLPTSVAFRVTDIWRSYFTQALLHSIGASLSFVTANAVQVRNAHDYLSDFNQEIDVYQKSGDIVTFLSQWVCKSNTTEECTEELADQFSARGYWAETDTELVKMWIGDLKAVGYKFPARAKVADYSIGPNERMRNCRAAHFDVAMNLPKYEKDTAKLIKRATEKIRDFSEMQDWCREAEPVKASNWTFASEEDTASHIAETEGLLQKYQTVAIITNNYPWRFGMGLLQRMYESSFGMLIFCGTYEPAKMDSKDEKFPPLRTPFTYIDVSPAEMNKGIHAYVCLNKVAEMRLRNVKGYVMFSDDALFNPWYRLDLATNYDNIRYTEIKKWWVELPETGSAAASRAAELLTVKYADRPDVKNATETYDKLLKLAKYSWKGQELTDIKTHITTMDSWIRSDLVYVPTSNLTFFKTVSEIFYEAGLFHEIVFSKYLAIMPNKHQWSDKTEMRALWPGERGRWPKVYNAEIAGMHPVKFSGFGNMNSRRVFCDNVLDVMHQRHFG